MRHISKPVNADASPYRAMLLPSCSFPRLYLTTHIYAVARRSLTLPSCCLSEHCRAHLCLTSAQLCRAAIRIASARPRCAQPSLSQTSCCGTGLSPCLAHHGLTMLPPCRAERYPALPLLWSAQPHHCRTIRCSASPSPRLAQRRIAVALQSFTWPSPGQGPRREAMISARGC